MQLDVELKDAQRYEECMARWRGREVVIERVFRGRGIRNGHIRANVFDDTKVRYVDLDELEPF